MSTVTLSGGLEPLAAKLADNLLQEDFFVPSTVVPATRPLRIWLQIQLARRLGVAINLQMPIREDALWSLLRAIDPRQDPVPPEPLDDAAYALMVLSILRQEKDDDLAPLRAYALEGAGRSAARRSWSLACRLGELIQDYEYHRQDALIQPWLNREPSRLKFSPGQRRMEAAQAAVFRHVVDENVGRRARLNRILHRNGKTFPQYAMEVMELLDDIPPDDGPKRRVHFFGLSHVSEFHFHLLGWLSQRFDIFVYQPNLLAHRWPGEPRIASKRPTKSEFERNMNALLEKPQAGESANDPGRALFDRWANVAGRESLALAWRNLQGFAWEWLPAPIGRGSSEPADAASDAAPTVLSRVQRMLASGERPVDRLPVDDSLQAAACPGAVREVEVIRQSIVKNLRDRPDLKLSDVAVFVTDIGSYRPLLQAAFDRSDPPIPYSLADGATGRQSLMGQAMLSMLDLALDSFTRSRVFELILNPCFLARLGVEASQAAAWLRWADALGIHHGWDAEEKAEQGLHPSPYFAWKLGLQRLRLGRFMDAADPSDLDAAGSAFHHVLPYADIDSLDLDQLGPFCDTLDRLLPRLVRLRNTAYLGKSWARILANMLSNFLASPEDRPEEADVERRLLASFRTLEQWDAIHPAADDRLALPLVREFVANQLERLPARKGDYLAGGVTIDSLGSMKAIPFDTIYLAGLGENHFPGSGELSSLDLRQLRQPGDIRRPENQEYLFLEAVLRAKSKLIATFTCANLQRDEEIAPCLPLEKLCAFVSEHVTTEKFEPLAVPLAPGDSRCVEGDHVWRRDLLDPIRTVDRWLAVRNAAAEGRITLTAEQREELDAAGRRLHVTFEPPPELKERDVRPGRFAVTIRELRDFLRLPAAASLRRHLRVGDEFETPALADDEPIVSTDAVARSLARRVASNALLDAPGDSAAAWETTFRTAYDHARQLCQVPEDVFGNIDADAIFRRLQVQMHESVLPLRERLAGAKFAGPVLLGQSRSPVGAKTRLPRLLLAVPGVAEPISVSGSLAMAWTRPDAIEAVVLSTGKKPKAGVLHDAMLEPACWLLALLALEATDADLPDDWAKPSTKTLAIHLAAQDGFTSFRIAPGAITPAEARDGIASLTVEFLDPRRNELLPFQMLKDGELASAFLPGAEPTFDAATFRAKLLEAISEADESDHHFFEIPLWVRITGAVPPADSLDIVKRRFGLLARWLAAGDLDEQADKKPKRTASRRKP